MSTKNVVIYVEALVAPTSLMAMIAKNVRSPGNRISRNLLKLPVFFPSGLLSPFARASSSLAIREILSLIIAPTKEYRHQT